MTIRDIGGYITSEDYELLFKLAQKHSVICEVDYREGYRDIAHTIFDINMSRISNYEIVARGIVYIYATTKEDFIEQCKENHVKFLVPEGK